MARLEPAAQRELADILKRLPVELRAPEASVKIRLADRPTREQRDAGIEPETITLQDRSTETTTVYLMNLFDRYAATPGDMRHELRRSLLQSIADALGQDWDLSEP